MEGKAVILSVLIMSMVLVQTQVEAKSCCPSPTGRNIYNKCRSTGTSPARCASLSGCKIVSSGECPGGYPKMTPETSSDAVNDYCKLGCASSLCGALITLQTFGANEIVNGAVEQCNNACSTLCTKAPMNALEID